MCSSDLSEADQVVNPEAAPRKLDPLLPIDEDGRPYTGLRLIPRRKVCPQREEVASLVEADAAHLERAEDVPSTIEGDRAHRLEALREVRQRDHRQLSPKSVRGGHTSDLDFFRRLGVLRGHSGNRTSLLLYDIDVHTLAGFDSGRFGQKPDGVDRGAALSNDAPHVLVGNSLDRRASCRERV